MSGTQSNVEMVKTFLADYPMLSISLQAAGVLLLAWLVDRVARFVALRLIRRAVRHTSGRWDDALLKRGAFDQLIHVLPAMVVFSGVALIQGMSPAVVAVVRNVASALIVLVVARAVSGALLATNDWYATRPLAGNRPIKGYIQIGRIAVACIAAILIIAVLIERSPLLLLSGLGAMTAVLMLVFKDTILSLVASVQLASNDMLRIGDWIEMPQLGADGDVIDIALHTVKVQNWDKTITTIPTWKMISESYKNWRGMQEFGGRRIKRSLDLDLTSARFLGEAEVDGLRRFALLRDHLDSKQQELTEWNTALKQKGLGSVNARRLTNLGCFRAYALAYLRNHPGINPDMTLIVRQLQPGPAGLPLEIYCFTRDTRWAIYEGVQSDIFDHLIAILPEFSLRLFQQPAGNDLRELMDQTGPSRRQAG